MKFYLLIFTLSLVAKGYSQKETHRIIETGAIESVVLWSDEIYKVSFSTVSGRNIHILTRTEGEYYNQIGLESEIQ